MRSNQGLELLMRLEANTGQANAGRVAFSHSNQPASALHVVNWFTKEKPAY